MARSLSQLFYALGGSVSPGKSNDELIDHLIDAEFIRTPAIQRVFRSVDRGNYYHPNHRQNAYKDIAWRMGNLHLSAPCVYSVVMETLKLKPGLSFLNLGSGSGYLSTMAGLLLGQYGVNHGIEYHEDIVEYAYERLDEFLKSSKVVDEHDFCEPVFTCGNCLTLDGVQQYDRVYCGAACPEEYEAYIKNLVKINGILIMPLNDKLLKITRVNETVWTTVKVLSVSFAPLILPPPTKKGEVIEHAKLGGITPPTLLQLCRFEIRAQLRNAIETEHPKLRDIKKLPPQRNLKLFIFDNDSNTYVDDSDGDGENLDRFSLLVRSIRYTSCLFTGSSSHGDGEGSNERDELREHQIVEMTRVVNIRGAIEAEERARKMRIANSLTLIQPHAKQIVESLPESEKSAQDTKSNDKSSSDLKTEEKSDTDTSSKNEQENKREIQSLLIIQDHPKQIANSLPENEKVMHNTKSNDDSSSDHKTEKKRDAKTTDTSSKDEPENKREVKSLIIIQDNAKQIVNRPEVEKTMYNAKSRCEGPPNFKGTEKSDIKTTDTSSKDEQQNKKEVENLTLIHDHAKQVVDSLPEVEKKVPDSKSCDDSSSNVKKVEEKDSKNTDSFCEIEEKNISSFVSRNRVKDISVANNSCLESGKEVTAVDKENTCDSFNAENEMDDSVAQDSSSSDLDLSPEESMQQDNQDRTTDLKRKHSGVDGGASTSAGCNSPVPKKRQRLAFGDSLEPTTMETFSRAVKVDSNNRISEEFSHTYYLTQKIAALPLPAYLKKYVNYKRDISLS